MPFERIAIVNRGEAAMRLLHAVEELNRGVGHPAGDGQGRRYRTIALYTEPDRHSWFVREADEAYCLGPATMLDGRGGSIHTYLDYERLEAALLATGAEAAWVGWGFVSEHAAFAELCERLGVTFIGPPSDVIRRLGDKIEAKRLAELAAVPVSPWSGGPVESAADAHAAAASIGYPLLVKAASGGGGRGIRLVQGPEDLGAAVEWARAEAQHAFGDPTV
ncbi:MAG TPA: biotin carboxylase N-terminal domain-containing protein, partial [Acidimicrobiales bacterium]|nr:biotin carboxylase N-terminal domain-containing protein [Acidimicrobiales bacterium]